MKSDSTVFDKRIIASSMIYGKRPLEGALAGLKEAGFKKVELCIAKSMSSHYEYWELSEEKRIAAAKTVADSGLKVSAANHGGGLRLINGETDSVTRTFMLEAMHFTSLTGAKIISFGAGVLPDGIQRFEYLKKINAYYKELSKIAREEYGLVLSVEAPHKKTVAEKPEEIFEYWEIMDPSIKCTLDIAHFIYGGGDLKDAAQKLSGRISIIHLRDAVVGDSLKRFGEGIIDFRAFFGYMHEAGYEGEFSLEFPSDDDNDAAARISHIKDFFRGMVI